MTSTSALVVWAASALGPLLFAGAATAQPPPSAPAASTSAVGRMFAAGLERLGVVFKGIGSLSGGAVEGAVWRVELGTGERRRIGAATDMTWPVPSFDGTAVYALRHSQVVRIAAADGRETPIGTAADWRKLIGVLPDNTVLGFVEADPRPRPALLAPDGTRAELPPPTSDAERQRNGALLQEGRDYADGTRLEVRDSQRGGRGRDVFLIAGAGSRNLTDCGDDVCGQPVRSQDGRTVFYIRAPQP